MHNHQGYLSNWGSCLIFFFKFGIPLNGQNMVIQDNPNDKYLSGLVFNVYYLEFDNWETI